jgi:hypothetical protein
MAADRVAGLEGWIMGMILTFVARSREATHTASSKTGKAQTCEIVLFPGVRYERWSDESEKPAPQKKRAKKRKRVQRKRA